MRGTTSGTTRDRFRILGRSGGRRIASFLVVAVLFATAGVALADNVQVISPPSSMTVGTPVSVSFWLQEAGSGPDTGLGDCDASVASPVPVTLSAEKHSGGWGPAGADLSFSQGSLTFTGCGIANPRTVQITANTAGRYKIGGSSTVDGVNVNPAGFEVTASVASNTAPTTPGTPALSPPSASPNTGSFTLGWTASTDAQSDTITYTLERKSGASAATWEPVSSTISTNSYTFASHPEGSWIYRVKASDGSLSSGYSTESSGVKVDLSAPNAPILEVVTSTTDSSTRTPNYVATGPVNWFRGSAVVRITDNGDPALADTTSGSGVAGLKVDAGTTVVASPQHETKTSDGSHTVSAKAVDNVGHESSAASVTFSVDGTAPTSQVTGVNQTEYPLGGTMPTLGCTANDGTGSGVSSHGSIVSSPDNSTVGTKSVQCNGAEDNVGNVQTTASAAVTYKVVYPRDLTTVIGQPINPDNTSKFNQKRAVPVKFGLAGDGVGTAYPNGYPVGGFSIQRISSTCESFNDESATSENVEPVSSSTTFRYDATSDQYIYNANLSGTSIGSCYKFRVSLGDGTTILSPLFQVTK